MAYVSAQDLAAGEHELTVQLVYRMCAPSRGRAQQVKVNLKEIPQNRIIYLFGLPGMY